MKDLTKVLKPATDLIIGAGSLDPVNGMTWNPNGLGGNGRFPMFSPGNLHDDNLTAKLQRIDVPEIGGGTLQLGHEIAVEAGGMELDTTDLAIAETFAALPETAHFLMGAQDGNEIGRLMTEIIIDEPIGSKPKGKFSVRGSAFYSALYADGAVRVPINLGVDVATSTREWYRYRDILNKTRRKDLAFEVYPYLGNFGQSTRLYDASQSRRACVLTGDPVWSTTPNRLIFDGVNDYADFGDILQDDGVSDFMVDCWFRVNEADGLIVPLMGTSLTGGSANVGWVLLRDNNNKAYLRIADGVTGAIIVSAALVLQNVWTHVGVAIDRNGNGQVYINGVANGSPVSVAAIGNGDSPYNFKVGVDAGTNYGGFALGAARVYRFGAGLLPSNIAGIILANYNTERAIFGV